MKDYSKNFEHARILLNDSDFGYLVAEQPELQLMVDTYERVVNKAIENAIISPAGHCVAESLALYICDVDTFFSRDITSSEGVEVPVASTVYLADLYNKIKSDFADAIGLEDCMKLYYAVMMVRAFNSVATWDSDDPFITLAVERIIWYYGKKLKEDINFDDFPLL